MQDLAEKDLELCQDPEQTILSELKGRKEGFYANTDSFSSSNLPDLENVDINSINVSPASNISGHSSNNAPCEENINNNLNSICDNTTNNNNNILDRTAGESNMFINCSDHAKVSFESGPTSFKESRLTSVKIANSDGKGESNNCVGTQALPTQCFKKDNSPITLR